MEERIIDNEREIKIKRKRTGDDAVDALAEDDTAEEIPEEELILEIPEGDEYDEDLVGLTPSQLKEELARREKARQDALAECEKLTRSGEEELAAGNYAEAEKHFAQALFYNAESVPAGKGLWLARTENFTKTEAFYESTNAEEFGSAPEEVRAFVLEEMLPQLQAEREEYEEEAQPLKEQVEREQSERREPFLANRRYYRIRLAVSLAALCACAIAIIVCVSMMYSTSGMLPVWCAVGFGVLAAVCLAFMLVFLRKELVAGRLCVANEQLSSTKEGARLEYLQSRLKCLELILGE